MSAIRHRTIEIEGLRKFVREAGNRDRPTLVLLPGYPSSTRAFVRLIDRLAPSWHAVGFDYPGFGVSDPLPESPTFDRLAAITATTIDALGIGDYALYMFDFGAGWVSDRARSRPPGPRYRHPKRQHLYRGPGPRGCPACRLVARARGRPAHRRRVRQPARHADAMASRRP